MKIEDVVYGEVEINDSVLIELINSKPLQRLKKIKISGVVYKVKPWKTANRYEHCLGVMILLRKKGALIDEQIAGLLHDVPHTAFSHAIDYVFKNDKQEYHEQFHEKIINNSEIPKILLKHGFDLKKILDENNFTLLEQNIPDLCADRIDYTLREFVQKEGTNKRIQKYLDSLVVKDNKFVFNNKKVAKSFSEEFLEMVQVWAEPGELAIVEIIADVLKEGLNKKIITKDDLFTTDNAVLEKLEAANNKKINDLLSLLNPKLKVIFNKKDYDYYTKEKNRFINPLIVPENKRVSEIYPDFKEKLEKHKEILERGIYAKIIK